MLLEQIWKGLPQGLADEYVDELILNGGFTGVLLKSGAMGVAMNVRSGTETDAQTREFLGTCIGQDCQDVCSRVFEKLGSVEKNTPERFLLNSILIAIFNAFSGKWFNEEDMAKRGLKADIGAQGGPASTLKEGEVATIVGYGGMVRPMSKIAKKTFVTELEPELFSSYRITRDGIEKGPTCTTVVKSSEQEKNTPILQNNRLTFS